MRKLITTLIYTAFALLTYGQRLEIPATPITYDLKFSIHNPNGFGLKVARKDTATILPDGILSIQTRINDADLVLQAKVTATKNKNKELQKFKLVLKDKYGVEIVPEISDYVNYQENTDKKVASNTIIWKNITEDNSFLANEYTLTYYVEKYILVGIDCENPPKFGSNEQVPYLAGALLGAGLMTYSRETRDDALTAFKKAANIATQYQTDWENGEGQNADLLATNKKFIMEGNKLNERQKRQFIGGAIVLGVDLIAYIAHRAIYQRRKKLADEYCTDKKPLQIKPVIKASDATSFNHQIGLGLTYTF